MVKSSQVSHEQNATPESLLFGQICETKSLLFYAKVSDLVKRYRG